MQHAPSERRPGARLRPTAPEPLVQPAFHHQAVVSPLRDGTRLARRWLDQRVVVPVGPWGVAADRRLRSSHFLPSSLRSGHRLARAQMPAAGGNLSWRGSRPERHRQRTRRRERRTRKGREGTSSTTKHQCPRRLRPSGQEPTQQSYQSQRWRPLLGRRAVGHCGLRPRRPPDGDRA